MVRIARCGTTQAVFHAVNPFFHGSLFPDVFELHLVFVIWLAIDFEKKKAEWALEVLFDYVEYLAV